MPEKKDSPIFGEKEIGPILNKALKLQHEQQAAESKSGAKAAHGLSLAELQQIAADVGIDPHFVALAAANPDAVAESGFQFWGGPMSFTREHIVAGNMDDEKWQEIVPILRKTFPVQGESEKVGTGWEWKDKSGVSPVLCSVIPRGDQVKITFNVIAEEWGIALPMLMGVFGFLILMFGIFATEGDPLLSVGTITVLSAALYLFMRKMYGGWMKSQQRRVDQAIKEISEVFAEERLTPQRTTVSTPPALESRPTLNLGEMQTDGSSVTPRGRTRV